jgi:hypothetical protein
MVLIVQSTPSRKREDQLVRDVFLSYRYDPANEELARKAEELIESHNLRAVTGDVLGGEAITPELLRQIEEADCLVALLTRRDQLVGGGWTTHPFCVDELKHARSKAIPAIALLEEGVTNGGMFQEHEYITFRPEQPLAAFLKLSSTLWRWKLRGGRLQRVQLLPSQLTQDLYTRGRGCRWEYRVSNGLRDSTWTEVEPRKEGQGVFLLVRVQDDTTLIDVKVDDGAQRRSSGFVALQVPVSLPEQG